jgi:hypothetical protein
VRAASDISPALIVLNESSSELIALLEHLDLVTMINVADRSRGIAKILKKRQLHTRQGCHQVDVGLMQVA